MGWLARHDTRRGTVAHRTIGVASPPAPSEPDAPRADFTTDSPNADEPEQRTWVRISPPRAGRYVIADEAGHRLGTIFGDYVIGFRVRCWDMHRTFKDLDEAKLALHMEAEARDHAGLRTAS